VSYPLPLLTQKLTSSGDTYALTNLIAMKGRYRCAAGTLRQLLIVVLPGLLFSVGA
jgi:hypothetical protein